MMKIEFRWTSDGAQAAEGDGNIVPNGWDFHQYLKGKTIIGDGGFAYGGVSFDLELSDGHKVFFVQKPDVLRVVLVGANPTAH